MKKKLILTSLLFSSFIFYGCSNNNEELQNLKTENSSLKKEVAELKEDLNASNKIEQTSNSSTKKDSKIFSLNEEAFVYDDSGKELYSIRITEATSNIPEDRYSYVSDQPEKSIQLTFEYKNYGMDEAMSVTQQFFTMYNLEGKAGKETPYLDGQNKVTTNKSASSIIWFVMPNETKTENEVLIDYSDDFVNKFAGTIQFKVPVYH